MKGLLRSVEEKKSELEEQLKSANASVEQYRSVVLTLEDSLEKEKEVQLLNTTKYYTLPCAHLLTYSHTDLSSCLATFSSGGSSERVGRGAEAAGEEDFRVGENEAARARGKKKGCGCSGETSEL